MESLVELIARWVISAKGDMGRWGDVILVALAVVAVGGIIGTVYVLWS
jgi:hypothetical protein